MTEEDARDWAAARYDAGVLDRLDAFAALVTAENERQNLIAPSTVETIWSRHILDSLQLIALAPSVGSWLDIGTGGGFPGLVVAIARDEQTMLVEPRRKRAEFLASCVKALGLTDVMVRAEKIERVDTTAAVISARAVSSLENLLHAAAHCATPKTTWLLPRGTVDPTELETSLRRSKWMFHVEQSLTSETSSIVVLTAR